MPTMAPFRVSVVEPFPYSADGVTTETKVPGEVFDVRADLLPGLLAEGKVEESGADPTPPDELARLRAAHADPALLTGVTPAVVGLARASYHTEVADEHAEPVRRRAAEQAARGRAAPAVAPSSPEDGAKAGGEYETKDERPAPRGRRKASDDAPEAPAEPDETDETSGKAGTARKG